MSDKNRRTKPDFIGKYRVDSVIGSGAMGIVYRGFDTAIEREVAIKTIRGELLSSEDGDNWRERFVREVRVAARCLHPNLVTVFDCGEHEGIPYIVMEYVAGRPLQDFQGAQGFEIDTAVYVTSQLLRALEVAHAAGIVHRDIKPGNIILLDNALVKVTDFGIARMESSTLTAHGSMVGTPSYMSPEQFLGGDVDARSDLFSAGVVLYEMICRQRPFQGKSNAELLYRVANDPPPDPRSLNPGVSGPLAEVMVRALAKRPEDRFQSAREFAQALAATESDPAAATVIAMSPNVAPMPAAGARIAAGFDQAVLEKIEKELTAHIGPIAKLVVRKAAKECTSEEEFRQALIVSCGEGPASQAFRRTLDRTSLTSHSSMHSRHSAEAAPAQRLLLQPEVITATQRSLASFIGPLARVLVDKAALRARDEGEFYRVLAESIPTEAERVAFLKRHLGG